MMIKRTKFTYYDFNTIYERNGVFNFVVGARGLGKTYGAKKKVLQNVMRKGEQFIYLRRYKTELHTFRTFFADMADDLGDYGWRINGHVAEYTQNPRDKKPSWHTGGYCVPLSNAQNNKSISYHDVTSIIFDEFIIEKGHVIYLPNEPNTFNEFYSTVDRYQDKTRVFFLANAISLMNPYFIHYNIRPNRNQEWLTRKKNFIVCHFPDAKQYASEVEQTRFGQFIKGTDYANYAIANEFKDDDDRLIAAKPPEAIYERSIRTMEGWISVWRYKFIWYVQNKRPKEEICYTNERQFVTESISYLNYGDPRLSMLRNGYESGRLFFSDLTARNSFIQIFKR